MIPVGSSLAEKEEKIEFEGEVIEALSNGKYRVELDNGHTLLAYVAGKMRRFRIRILPGDRIKVELSPYDLTRGGINHRYLRRPSTMVEAGAAGVQSGGPGLPPSAIREGGDAGRAGSASFASSPTSPFSACSALPCSCSAS